MRIRFGSGRNSISYGNSMSYRGGSSTHAKWVLVLGGLAFMLGGFFCTYISIDSYMTGMETESWPTTEAIITKSEVEETQSTERTRRGNSTRTRTRTSYHAKFSYNYTVDGAQYTGKKFQSSKAFTATQDYNEELVRKYPLNAKINIAYNPANPSDAVMEKGASSADLAFAGMGVVFFCVGLFFLSLKGKVPVVGASGLPIAASAQDATGAEVEAEKSMNVSNALIDQLGKQNTSAFDPLADPTKKKTGT